MRFVSLLAFSALCLLPLSAQNAPPAQSPVSAPAQQVPPPASSASLPPPANPAAHTTLTGNVMDALTSNPQLGSIPITVSVTDNGDVSLNGVVPTPALENEAVSVVKAVPGVRSVNSRILVNEDPFAPRPAASVPASGAPSTQPLQNSSNNPQYRLAEALKAAPDLVRVSGHIIGKDVAIFGTVTSDQAKQQAMEIAKKALPGYNVTNLIWVDENPLAPAPLIPTT
ncbi:MAG TPA: BON domain-containing protein [Chloroflexota bacterium]|nr:BON domain-containing protein [Chloroflexota bacterium]